MTTLDILIAIEADVAEAQAWTSTLKAHDLLNAPLAGLKALIATEQARQQELPGVPHSVRLEREQIGFIHYTGTSIPS